MMTDDERLRAVEQRLAMIETVNAVNGVHSENVEARLSAIESTLQWLVRLIIGALILAVVAFAIRGGFKIA